MGLFGSIFLWASVLFAVSALLILQILGLGPAWASEIQWQVVLGSIAWIGILAIAKKLVAWTVYLVFFGTAVAGAVWMAHLY